METGEDREIGDICHMSELTRPLVMSQRDKSWKGHVIAYKLDTWSWDWGPLKHTRHGVLVHVTQTGERESRERDQIDQRPDRQTGKRQKESEKSQAEVNNMAYPVI